MRVTASCDLTAALAAGNGRWLDAEPAAAALLREERERLERRLAGRRERDELLGHLRSLRRTLYPYQREGIRRFFEEQRLVLADDMGLGKTTQAVAACHALLRAGRVSRGLLIVPAALKPQWIREWQAVSDAPIASVDGRPDERRRQYASTRRGFLVIGYEQLLRDLEAVHGFDPEVVVLDEAQRIKNWETKPSAYVKSLRPRYRLVLTGTPMENRLEELASLLDWVDDVALAPKWRLDPWHTWSEGDGDTGTSGARNLDTLRKRLEPVLVRRVRREVLSQLPERTDTRVSVPMTPAQQEEHDALIPPIAAILGRARRRPLTQPEFLKLMTLLTTQRILSNGLAQGSSPRSSSSCGASSRASPSSRGARRSSSASGGGCCGWPGGPSATSWRRPGAARSSSPAPSRSAFARRASSTSTTTRARPSCS